MNSNGSNQSPTRTYSCTAVVQPPEAARASVQCLGRQLLIFLRRAWQETAKVPQSSMVHLLFGFRKLRALYLTRVSMSDRHTNRVLVLGAGSYGLFLSP